MALRADIGEEERLLHSCGIPLVVSCWTHVTTVVTRGVVVVVGGAWAHLLVLCKHFLLPSAVAIGMCLREVPGYPVGVARLHIIRGGIALTLENLFRTVRQWSWLLIFHYFVLTLGV